MYYTHFNPCKRATYSDIHATPTFATSKCTGNHKPHITTHIAQHPPLDPSFDC
jgi:hypothetical protein